MARKTVLVDVFNLLLAQTGVRTYTEELCEQVFHSGKRKHEYVVVPNYDWVRSTTFFHGKTSKARNIIYHIIYFGWKQVMLPFLAWRRRADIIFCPDFIVPAVRTRAVKVPVIHDAFFWENPESYNSHWLRYFKKMVLLGLRGRSVVVTTTEYSADRLRQWLPVGTRFEVVYQGSKFEPGQRLKADPSWKLGWGLVPGAYFLHVGVLEKRKNLPLLIKAFDIFRSERPESPMKLVLAGQRGPRENLDDYPNIAALIETLKLSDSVLLTGHLAADDLQTLYSKAFCYVFPSSSEGFGLPVLEAFANDLPVITSETGALIEVGGDATLRFSTHSEEELASKMLLIYDSESLRSELVQKGRTRLKDFGWDKFFQSLEIVFDKG